MCDMHLSPVRAWPTCTHRSVIGS